MQRLQANQIVAILVHVTSQLFKNKQNIDYSITHTVN